MFQANFGINHPLKHVITSTNLNFRILLPYRLLNSYSVKSVIFLFNFTGAKLLVYLTGSSSTLVNQIHCLWCIQNRCCDGRKKSNWRSKVITKWSQTFKIDIKGRTKRVCLLCNIGSVSFQKLKKTVNKSVV